MKPLSASDSLLLRAPDLAALEDCDEASIYAPGSIQPHGLLLVLAEPALTILQVSENVEQFLGVPPAAVLGRSLRQVVSRSQVRHLQTILADGNLAELPFELKIQRRSPTDSPRRKPQLFRCGLQRTLAGCVLELEPQPPANKAPTLQFYHRLQTAVLKLRESPDLAQLAQVLAQEVKAIAGFDRVMVYRFEQDDHGVVIAEEKEAHLESYLGLHYPAFDIPLPARKLFRHNWVRQIPDVHYPPTPILRADGVPDQPGLDLSGCVLRGVSPYHIEYLQNMGVAATLTISLIDDQRLWGLIACHHMSPRLVSYETRKTCEFLGQFASIELVHQQERDLNQYRNQVKAIQDQLQWAFLRHIHALEPVLVENASQLLNLVHAQGAALLLDNQLTLVGQTPDREAVQDLIAWLVEHRTSQLQEDPQGGDRVFATHTLPSHYPPAEQFKHCASGVLAISIVLSQVRQTAYHILWFRPEQIQTVDWAGNPQGALTQDELGSLRLCPRKSFELWKETVQGMSQPWQRTELEAAAEMRNTLMLAVLEFSQAALEQAAERAAIANRAKSQFLAKMSHELRTPLNAILGFTQLMARNQETPAEFQQQLGIISRSGEHLLTLINDVLEMSKIEAGQLVLTESCFDIHRLLLSIHEMFALKALEKGLEFAIEWDPEMTRYGCGDEAKLRQIMINLLSNAIKFTVKGIVRVRLHTFPASTVPLPESPPGDRPPAITLQVEVEDTGPGITVSEGETIFEAFMQTERGRHAQGTGLGLSISRQFARLMGGDVTVRSNPPHGSTFTCRVQLQVPESFDAIQQTTPKRVIGLDMGQPRYRILVAEDVAENRQLLVSLLTSVGFEVRAVENGAEVIAHWRTWHPHLILMDIQMPEMDGYEATQKIRALEALAPDPSRITTPIIALTAYAFEEDRTTSLQTGCTDHIAKPFAEAELFSKIARHLGIRYRYSEELPFSKDISCKKNLSPQDLGIMGLEWITQVHDAALDLDDLKLRQLIAQIPPQEQPLIEAITALVDNFQLEAIADLTHG